MGKPIESQIKKMIDDIDHHLEEIDERLDKIRHILDSVAEAVEVTEDKKPGAAKKPEKQEREKKQEKGKKQETQEGEEVAEPASKEKDVYGNCPLCGSPLLVLGRAPLVVECSNLKCRNTFTPK